MRRASRTAAALGAALLSALPLVAGCGIRTTTVPVDAGPAPSRVSCAVPRLAAAPEPDAVVRQVYLVCSMQIAAVKRNVVVRRGLVDRLAQIRELIAQVQRSPLSAEGQAGFSTAVPGALEVDGPRKGDPRDAVRLSQPLDELPSFALAQIVCTLTEDPTVSPTHTVVLGGAAEDSKVRSYTCTPDLRTRPDAADAAGTALD